MEPLNPDTFAQDLDAIRAPKEDTVRKPLQWVVPSVSTECDDKADECADRAFFNMMSYVKLLQKHYSDMIMTENIKKFTDEENELWEKDRKDIMFKIVEHFSIIEFVRVFPKLSKPNEDGKMVFDLSAFHPHLKQAKNGGLYVDEYKIQEDVKASCQEKQQLIESHVDYDKEKGRMKTIEEIDNVEKKPDA